MSAQLASFSHDTGPMAEKPELLPSPIILQSLCLTIMKRLEMSASYP